MLRTKYSGGNILVDELPEDERHLILRHCKHVMLQQGESIGLWGEAIHTVYFPLESVVSVMSQIDGKDAIEAAVIGNEGVVGSTLMLGAEAWPIRASVQIGGGALCMKAADFRQALLEAPIFEPRVRLHASTLFVQVLKTAACLAAHTVEARLASYLLMMQAHAHHDGFYVTDETLARALGAGSNGIVSAIRSLRASGLISDMQSHIQILEHDGLARRACSCHEENDLSAIQANASPARVVR